MASPTVGRIVHYYTADPVHHFNGQGDGPYPAIVMQCFNKTNSDHDTMANLKVLHWGGSYDAGSVYEKEQATAHGHTGSWWVWPPRE